MHGGKRIGAGRPAGTPNKLTHEIREQLHQFTSKALNDLPRLFKELPFGKDRVDVLIKLLPYVAPRMQAIAIEQEPQEQKEMVVRIVYAKDDNEDTPPFASDEAHIDFNRAK